MIPEQLRDLLDKAIVVVMATVMPDGQPQATPVWCSYDGEKIWINTAVGRQKDKNLQRDPKVTILAMDPSDVHRWIEVRGHVVERTEEGAVDHINQLSKLYRGADYYATRPEKHGKETRVIYKIQPDRISTDK